METYFNRDDFRIGDFEHRIQKQFLEDRSQASGSGLLLDGETSDAVESVSRESQFNLKENAESFLVLVKWYFVFILTCKSTNRFITGKWSQAKQAKHF